MHRFRHAITRLPGPNFADGLTTASWSEAPSHAGILARHRAYVAALRELGLSIEVLPALPLPDAYFVEDVAVVVPELAILTHPGAEARRAEVEFIAEALAAHRPLARLVGHPGQAQPRLDGGDVMICEREVYVGLSGRSDAAGVAALAALLEPHGYRVHAVAVPAGLHLKSSVNLVGPRTLLMTPAFAELPAFASFERVVLDEADGYAANALWINEHLLIAAGFPRVRVRVAKLGHTLVELDMREVAAMDGGLSCLSLRL